MGVCVTVIYYRIAFVVGKNTISQASVIVVDSSTWFPAIMDYRTSGKDIQEDDIILVSTFLQS